MLESLEGRLFLELWSRCGRWSLRILSSILFLGRVFFGFSVLLALVLPHYVSQKFGGELAQRGHARIGLSNGLARVAYCTG